MNRKVLKHRAKLPSLSAAGQSYTYAETTIHFHFAAQVARGKGWDHTHSRYLEMKAVCLELGIQPCTFDEFRAHYHRVYAFRFSRRILGRAYETPFTSYLKDLSDPDVSSLLKSANRGVHSGW